MRSGFGCTEKYPSVELLRYFRGLVHHVKCVTTDHKMMVLQSVSPCHLHLICSIPATGEKPTVIYCKQAQQYEHKHNKNEFFHPRVMISNF